MRFLLLISCVAALLGCAERDEIIATVPADGGGGAGGQGGAPGPIVALGEPIEHTLVCGQASDMAAGDVDGDGVTDLLVGGGCLHVLRGDGDGLDVPVAPVLADFGDTFAVGYVDSTHPDAPTDPIDVVGFSQPTRVYLGDGTGDFTVMQGVDGGPAGGAVTLTNLYGDGSLELVTSRDATVELWTGDGTGAFVGPHPFALPGVPHAMRSADFDGDTHQDLLVATAAGVVLLRNDGNAALAAAEIVSGTMAVVDIALADLDGDGCMDALALESGADAHVLVLRNDCSGHLSAEPAMQVPRPVAIAAADLDADGVTDVVIAAETAVHFAGGLGDGSLGHVYDVPLEITPTRLLVANLGGDGRPDIALAHAGGVTTRLTLSAEE